MLKRNTLVASIWVLLLTVWALPAGAELMVDTAWVRRYDGPDHLFDKASAVAADGSGNVYVTGESEGAVTGYDYATIKYYPNGDTAWVRRYNPSGNYAEFARAIAVDNSGNVYVTGYAGTVTYDAGGNQVWTGSWGGVSIALDDSGNVYVAGSNGDYVTAKYFSYGDTAWVRTYDGPGNGWDEARAVAVDDSGGVYVTGTSWGARHDYATIKYYPNGDTAWVRRYNGPGNDDDDSEGIAVDDSGNVYVTGGSQGNGTMQDYATIKYYPDGDTAWVRRHNGSANSTDYAYAIATDGSGSVYVTGCSRNNVTSDDYVTIKYYPGGDTAWVRAYDAANNGDLAYAIAVDGSGNAYVTGHSYRSWTLDDYATLKYYSNGDSAWVRRYNGPGYTYDVCYAIALDDLGNVYVAGYSDGGFRSIDYATIKYSPALRQRGDANGDGSIDIGDVVYLINYLYKYGSAPDPVDAGDCNCDGEVNVGDVVYLVNYLYRGGDPPSC